MTTSLDPRTFVRTAALLGPETMKRLTGSCVAVAGLGGVGGAMLSTLARMGIGRFRIADPGVFDPPDLNRQWAATLHTLGKSKVAVYADFLRSVNPEVQVERFPEGITADNCDRFLDGADMLLEALDVGVQPSLRKKLSDAARARKIYNILPPVVAFGAFVTVSSPEGMPMDPVLGLLERARAARKLPPGAHRFFCPEHVGAMEASMAKGMIPSTAIAISLVSAVATTEALWILGGKTVPGWRAPVCLPKLIVVDLTKPSCTVRDIGEVESA